MKRFWLVLFSLGLVIAFSASALAVDVKFSGTYYAAGMYLDKTTFVKDGYFATLPDFQNPTHSDGSPSTAFFYQRLRLQTDFIVSPSLKMVTRFDVMERSWGAKRSDPDGPNDFQSAQSRHDNENIAFDLAYVEYTSPIGLFAVGYMDDGPWGTVFGDTSVPQGGILWAAQARGWTVALQAFKLAENSYTINQPSSVTDNDTDKYEAVIMHEWKGGQAGVLGVYYREASGRPQSFMGADVGFTGNVFILEPYAIVEIGPAKIQAEVNYAWGKVKADDVNDFTRGQDIKVDNLAAWIDATVNMNQFYFGGSFAYVAGQDWSNYNSNGKMKKVTGGLLTGGMDWDPTLLLFNNQRHYWVGPLYGNNVTSTYMNYISQQYNLNDTGMYNAWFFQGRAGMKPIDQLNIMASVSYAKADDSTLMGAPDAVDDEYGTEIDLIGTYKITNNLSYMVGMGYLFTGDYFKGFDDSSEVNDNFILINKLTLTF